MASLQYTYSWYIRLFEQAKERAGQLQTSAEDTLLIRKPSPDTWSAAECVAHLNEFGNIYFENINRGIETADPDEAKPSQSFPPRLIWQGIIKIFEPPYKLKLKTLNEFKPAQTSQINTYDVFNGFFELQDRFVDQLKRCRQKGIHLNNEKVGNPALPFIKMTLSESYAIAEAHQRRHLWQAEQVLANFREHEEN